MKHYLFISISCLFMSHLCAQNETAYAKQWADTYLRDADGKPALSQEELQALVELVDISFARSQATLTTQQAGLEALNMTWQLYHNVACTRLNPSHERPFAIDEKTREHCMQSFWHAYDAQAALCKTYDTTVASVVYSDRLTSNRAKNAVKELRTQARVFMLEALSDIRAHLGALYEIAFNKSEQTDTTQTRFGMRDITDFIMSYLPNLVVHRFIEADRFHITVSKESWHLLHKGQEIGNQVWHAIETARCAFYQALADELAQLAA